MKKLNPIQKTIQNISYHNPNLDRMAFKWQRSYMEMNQVLSLKKSKPKKR